MSLNENVEFYIHFFDLMSPKQRQISGYLTEMQSLAYQGIHSDISPKRETIARKSKCCRTTVRNFKKEFKGLIFDQKQRKIAGTVKNKSCQYYLHEPFYEMVMCLKFLNYFHKWKEVRKMVIEGIINDPHFLSKKVVQRLKLSTSKLTQEIYEKLTCIKSYIKEVHLDKGTKKEKVPVVNTEKKEPRRDILQGLPLSYNFKEELFKLCGTKALLEAKNDYHWYGKQNHIKLPERFFANRAIDHQIKILKRLKQ